MLLWVLLRHIQYSGCRNKRRQSQRVLGVLEGIHAELNTIYKQLISKGTRDTLEAFKKIDQKKDEPSAEDNSKGPEESELPFLAGWLRIPEDYLIVYRSNANLIGQINNSDLRREIVSTYMFLQIVMEDYKTYNTHLNSLLEKAQLALFFKEVGLESLEKKEELIKRTADFLNLSDKLKESSRKVLEDHESLTKLIKSLLKMLEEEIPLYGFFGFYRRFLRLWRRFLRFYGRFLTRSDDSVQFFIL